MPAEESSPPQDLEATLHAEPDNLEAWQVYGDWLQAQDDPRGELIALQVALEKEKNSSRKDSLRGRQQDLTKELMGEWLSPELLQASKERPSLLQFRWRFGFLEWVKVRTTYNHNEPSVEEMLQEILASASARFLASLSIGITSTDGSASFGSAMEVVAETGPHPSLRTVFVGDFTAEESEISWTDLGSPDPIYKGCPNLRSLTLRAGGIELGHLNVPGLKTLQIQSGGLSTSAAQSIVEADLPLLERLTIWFGDENYGAEVTPNMLTPLLTAEKLPALHTLGLMNAEFTNELPLMLAGSKLLAQIQNLDLSMGTMTDEGGRNLLQAKEHFQHLKEINVDDNFLSEELVEELVEAFGHVLISEEQKEDDDDFLYPSVGE